MGNKESRTPASFFLCLAINLCWFFSSLVQYNIRLPNDLLIAIFYSMLFLIKTNHVIPNFCLKFMKNYPYFLKKFTNENRKKFIRWRTVPKVKKTPRMAPWQSLPKSSRNGSKFLEQKASTPIFVIISYIAVQDVFKLFYFIFFHVI